MKAAALILIVLVLAAVGAMGYLYLKADLEVHFSSCIATDGVTQADYFDQLKAQLSAGTFIGTRYTQEDLQTADQYQFLTYTVLLRNNAFLKADVAEIRITPMQGDVLQMGDAEQHSIPAGKNAEITATILTARDMHSVREATVTCYFWGIPFSTKITLGSNQKS